MALTVANRVILRKWKSTAYPIQEQQLADLVTWINFHAMREKKGKTFNKIWNFSEKLTEVDL